MTDRPSATQQRFLRYIASKRKVELGRLYGLNGRTSRRTVMALLRRGLIDFADGPPGRVILTPSGKTVIRLSRA